MRILCLSMQNWLFNVDIFTPNYRVVTKTRNGMERNGTERNGLFHSILFQTLHPEAIQCPSSLNPKNFDFRIPNPKSNLFC